MRAGSAVALAVLGACIVVIGRVFGLLEMYVIGSGLVVASILAVVITRTRVVLVDVERRLSSREPRVGQDIGVELTLQAIRRSPEFEFSDFISENSGLPVGRSKVGPSQVGRIDISVPPLRRRQKIISRYRFQVERRGVVTLGPATATCGDPLGLAHRTRTIGASDEIVVSPHWTSIALPFPRVCEGELVRAIESLTRNLASELEFRSLRDYAPGDDARLVNWRASARRDSLVINEFESRSGVLLDVFVDDATSAYSDEGFENAIRVAASFVGSTALEHESELSVRLSFGRREDSQVFDAIIDGTTRREAMRSLALLSTSHREPAPQSVRTRTLLSIPVIISGRRDYGWLERTHRMMQGSSIAIVVRCDDDSLPRLPERWFGIRVEDFATFADEWACLSRRIQSS
ncbi:MAG: DUF58 domain-containing protein [Actinomycetota bacterium]